MQIMYNDLGHSGSLYHLPEVVDCRSTGRVFAGRAKG